MEIKKDYAKEITHNKKGVLKIIFYCLNCAGAYNTAKQAKGCDCFKIYPMEEK